MDNKSYSFKFNDIPFIDYPIYLKCKDKDEYYNFKKIINSCHLPYSRPYQLNHRSTQSQYFDLLLDLDHFKLLGLDYKFIPELPIINTDKLNDPDRNYYLLDYFIPSKSLAIELDSDYHDPIRDKLKDLFLASIGIDVYRIYNFQVDTKDKLDSLVQYIKGKDDKPFSIDYSNLIDEYREYELNQIIQKYGKLYFIRPKWKLVIELFCKLDLKFKYAIENKLSYKIEFTLDEIWRLTREVLPVCRKKVESYYPLMGYLKGLGIELKINSNGGRFTSENNPSRNRQHTNF